MKKQIVTLIVALLLMPMTALSQDIFEKYSDNPSVTYINIKPKMFQMLAKIDVQTDDPESQAYMNMVNSMTSFKTIVTDKADISSDILSWVGKKKNALEELMIVKDKGVEVKFYVKEGRDADHVAELLMFVNGLSAVTQDMDVNVNGEQRKVETVVVSMTGDIDLNQISKLTNQMDIPGGEHLKDQKKK